MALIQVELHHGGDGGKDFLFGLTVGIVYLTALSIIFVKGL